MSRSTLPQFGLCIDWETTGAKFGGDSSRDHQGIQFGAVIFRSDTLEEVKCLTRKIKFKADKYTWTEGAEKIHGLSRAHLEEHGVTQEDAAFDLLELLAKFFPGQETKVLVMGHNVDFDISFTNQLLQSVGVSFTEKFAEATTDVVVALHHVRLDTSSAGLIALGIFKSDKLFEAMGFEKRGDHDALQDARMTLQTAQALRLLAQAGLNG